MDSLAAAIGRGREELGGLNDKTDQYSGVLGKTKAVFEVLNPMMSNGFLEAKEATEASEAKLQKLRDQYGAFSSTVESVGRSTGMSFSSVESWIRKLKIPADMIGDYDYVRQRIKEASGAAATGSPGVESLTDAVVVLGDETATATDRMKAFKDAMDAALGIPKSLADAQREWQQSIADTTQSMYDLVATDPAAFAAGGASAFDLLTDSGRQTDAAISGLVDQGYALAESLAAANDSKGAADALMATRQAVIDLGGSFGIPTAELEGYLAKIGLTPAQIETFVALKGTEGANAEIDKMTAQRKTVEIVAQAITGEAEFGLAGVTDKRRVTEILANAVAGGAELDLDTAAGRQRIAFIIAAAGGVPQAELALNAASRGRIANLVAMAVYGNADADLNTVAGRQRIADIVANAITGQAEYGLAGVTDKGRVAKIIAEALASGADIDLNTVAGRTRIAELLADANLGSAPRDLDNAAKPRWALITARADVGGAVAQLDAAARDRYAKVYEQYVRDPAAAGDRAPKAFGRRWGGVDYSFAGGGFTPAHIANGQRIKYAEPQTGGELYLPRLGDRNRNLSILGVGANWMGMDLVERRNQTAMAAGGLIGYSPVPSGGGTTVFNQYLTMPDITVNGNGDETLKRIATEVVKPAVLAMPTEIAKMLIDRDRAVRS